MHFPLADFRDAGSSSIWYILLSGWQCTLVAAGINKNALLGSIT